MKNSLKKAVDKLGKKLKEKHLTLVTAESCTGGGIGYFLSRNPDVSAVLERGYVTYSTQAKQELLEVKAETIQLHGAVSKETAIEMAEGALKKSKAQVSIAVTGIAGSDTNNTEKMPGIVWIAAGFIDKKTQASKFEIQGKRDDFVDKVILHSLEYLLSSL